MKRAKFTIEGNQNTYNGYAEDRNWNGWACPLFPFDEARRIMTHYNQTMDTQMYYNETTDSFLVSGEIYKGVDIDTPDGIRHLYPIGNSCWIWEMQEIFTKADLKTGDVVKFRNNNVAIVNGELKTFITMNGFLDFDDFNDDLTEHDYGEWDIIAVRRPNEKYDCKFTAFNWNCGTLVYERPIVEEMTLAEVCKALGKEIKIVKE